MAVCSEDSPLLPLLETLEDSTTSYTEQTDAYLSIANRLTGEEGKEFSALVCGQFPRLCKIFKEHIANQNSDLSNAALQALGFCVFNNRIASGLSATETEQLLSALNCIAVKSTDKNTCTRALWVISKQSFPSEEVGKSVPTILSTLEGVLNKDVQSLVIEYEALNVVIRLLEQAPAQMTQEAVRWSKLVIPLVVHSAPKVRLRAATALEIGLPVLLQKHQDVSSLTEQLMTSKIIAELQKLFSSKNETYVLKLWPLFVKLLGKTLHRSGSFINSLLQLEELGFRSGSPAVKKIAFIAWKSLIDNFASNPDILCSSKRLKLLMQPLSSIHVRTEALALTKIEVWWYLLMRLGSQLSAHYEQVCLPLLQSTLNVDASSAPGTPLRSANLSIAGATPQQKGALPFGSPATPKISLNSSLLASISFPSVHLLGIEMMLHFLLGPEVVSFAAQHKLVLSLEPLQHPLISSSSFFSKHAATLLNAVQDGFITVGKDASDAVLNAVWKDMIVFGKAAMDTGSKKDRQGSEVLTHLLQALKNINLLEYTIKGLPQKVLGSAAYQVANMDLLNGTPALFIIQLHFHSGLLEKGVIGERFFINFETLVNYALMGPTSSLAFSESVLNKLNQNAKFIENKEHLWRMWSILINPLTEKINQTNEVNQGDALEHNFGAMHSALILPITHIFPVAIFPQPTMKTLIRTWSELYKVFARCASLVATAEENICCEELCARVLSGLGDSSLNLSLMERIVQIVSVIVESFNFTPYTTKFQPKAKSPHTPTDWAKKKRDPLGNLNSLMKLVVKLIESFNILAYEETQSEAKTPSLISAASSLIATLSTCISHVSLPSVIRILFTMLIHPISLLVKKTKCETNKVYNGLNSKIDKLLGDILVCLGSRFNGPYDSELLEVLSPILCVIFLHKNKQTRSQAAQFWNGSFAKATVLTYPEELKPVLNQVKSKTPLLLPGFTFLSEDLTGPHSENTDNSQLEAKVSGIEVRSAGKRDSLLARVEEAKDKGTPPRPTQAKLKLDFSSPKPKMKLLEEERSMDFIFIPPETKERVLTEHQKEVLRTKRVDIPAMYNNLDASQDTTLFTQYTQSQDNSSEMPAINDETKENGINAKENQPEVLPPENNSCKAAKPGEDLLVSDIPQSMKATEGLVDHEITDAQNNSNVSNGSSSSDMVLGTPPQPASRRQSFITLEKFDSSLNRTLSPLSNTKFPKATEVVLVPDSQESTVTNNAQTKSEKSQVALKPSKVVAKKGRNQKLSASENTEVVKQESAGESLNKDGRNEIRENNWVPESQTQDLEAKDGVESKENTPPETVNHSKDEASPSVQAASIQISLRRSSRRHSEILEGVKGGTNESKSPKPDKTRDEDKSVLKKLGQAKEAHKPPSEKKEQMQEKENLDQGKKSVLEAGTGKYNKAGNVKPDTNPPEGQDLTKSRSRYQTRRSSQGLLPAGENSESDNSETRDVNVKRKRSWKSKAKSTEADNANNSATLSEGEGRPQEEPAVKNEPTLESESLENCNTESGAEIETDADHLQTTEIVGKTYSLIKENTTSYSLIKDNTTSTTLVLDSEPAKVTNMTYDITKNSTNVGSTIQSFITEPSAGDFSTAVSEVFQQCESNLQISDCLHKRSKRTRRSKSCDCCGEMQNKGSHATAFKTFDKGEVKPKKNAHPSIAASEMSDTQFDVMDIVGPCAVSTPLALAGEPFIFKPSVSELKYETESEQETTVAPLNESKSEAEEVTQIFVESKAKEHNTTPTKGFVSPNSRILGLKSSKKNLISEMTKESMPSPKESVYPALMNCSTPVDVILPQITSNMWARGLGQLIRAKNIKTIGDLSTLTPSEIKTLPIRSPKVSTVKKALRVYHEQQAKTKGFDEFAVLDDTEKTVDDTSEKPCSVDEEKLTTDLVELSTSTVETTTLDLVSQISELSLQLSSEDLAKYSASQLFDMQEKLGIMSNCIIRHLQSRWKSPPPESSV
ncbi:hypothetical protein GDO86_016820 [Hymenochirus boettgeri]|uniref:Telomere-associated protein Rif1 N-terminal domain-containing protein n=1 Tax=Hymenochirus boettgeri TaxID=247094 RepID=A0A8T2IML3_9PIPI|nr:hypothetical protein GDO86_016820 [Hymenochirus boettgeri]